MVRKSEKNRES